MADYNITLDYSNTLIGMDQINKLLAERIHNAVGMAAQKVYESWADRVMKAPGIYQAERQAYVHSLKWDYTGPFSARVSTDYKIADEIETGRPARDLKRMLNTSSKVKIDKKGRRYLVIPFRHGTPGSSAHAPAMPADIYKVVGAKSFAKSKVLSQSYSHVGSGLDGSALINWNRTYQWGSRLHAGHAPKLKAHHTTDIYAGMRRMDTSTGKSKSSAYLTFRIMGEWQAGKWIVGAKPGQFIARQVAQDIQSEVENVIAEAFAE